MMLYEFTTVTSDDGERVLLASGRVADHPDPAQQKEWITFQFATDMPTAQNGALQRAKALEQVRDICHQLARDFGTAGHRRGQ